jgi:hypothetical protein
VSAAPRPPAVTDAMWRGPSGAFVAPTQIMDAITYGLELLEREGWNPALPFGVLQAITGDDDVRQVTGRYLDAILAYRTGNRWTDFQNWEWANGRTFREVQDAATAAGWYAAAAGAGMTA